MKTALILGFILLLMSFHSKAQQTIDKLNTNQLKLPKESVSKALILDATGQVKSSSTVTDTEVGYLDGLTDTLVNLLSGKANDADVVKLSPNQTVSGIKTFNGKLVTSSTTNGSIPCPEMTQTQRNALTPANGECVYNSTSLKLNIYDGSVWKDVGGSGGISLWATSTSYSVNDVVIQSDKIYICLIAHTSGTFATDLAAGNWKEISKVSTIKSQGVSVSNLDELQIQNNQLTQTGTNKFYVESGNKNILTNPSFEHSTFSTGWTNSAGTFTQELTNVVDGVASAKLVLSSQIMSLTQSSTLYQAQFADGIQGLASVRIKSSVALKVCSIQAGTVSTTNCVDVVANSKWGLYKVPFILGGTSNGISIASSGAVTGTVYIDDAFVAAVDLTQQVNSCDNARCETDFSVTVGNTGTVLLESMDWVTTCTNVSGTVACTFTTELTSSLSTGMTCVGNREGSSGGTVTVIGGSTTTTGFSFTSGNVTSNQTVYHCKKTGADYLAAKQRANGNTYSSKNADTDWASCGLTGAAFTGFGSSVPTPELQCKRQGADLLIKGKFTAGTTPTAVEARMALPTWNGVQLVSAGSSVIPSIQLAGPAVLNFASATYFGFNVLIEPSVAYTTFSLQTSSANGLTKQTGASIALSGQVMSINARIPIEGWQGSNIIVGSFSGLQNCTSTLACTDTFSAYVSAAGVVSNENVDWISGNCSVVSTNQYTCTYVSGLVTQPMNCQAVVSDNVTITSNANMYAGTSTSLAYQTYKNIDSVAIAQPVSLSCQKQGADYVGKTAVAVASDQNIATPGVTKIKNCFASWGGAGALSAPTNCTTTPCTEYYDSCGAVSSVTRSSTGIYVPTFANGTFLSSSPINCMLLANDGSFTLQADISTGGDTIATNSSGGYAPRILSTNVATSGTVVDSRVSISCIGQAP